MKKVFVLFAICFIGGAVLAQNSDEKVDCKNPGSNFEMKLCASMKLEKKELELTKILKQIEVEQNKTATDLPEDAKEILSRLKLSQETWIKHREANCKLESIDMLGGTGEGLIYIECLQGMTVERIKNLKTIFGLK